MRATHAGPRNPGRRFRTPWLGLMLALTSACATFGRGATTGGPGEAGLEEITPANVASLRPVCTFDLGDAEPLQTGLTAVNGVVYLSTDTATFAIQGATCALLWRHAHASRPRSPSHCDQGFALRDGRIFRTFGDGHVLAMDAASGRTLWDVAVAPAAADGSSSPMVSGARATATGLVFTNLDGTLRAFEASTGNERWRGESGQLLGGGVVGFVADGQRLVAVGQGSVSGAPVQGGRSRLVVLGVQGPAGGPERRRPVYIE